MCKVYCRACRARKVHETCYHRIVRNKGCFKYLSPGEANAPIQYDSNVVSLPNKDFVSDAWEAKRAWGQWLGARPEFGLDLKRIEDQYLFATYTIADTKLHGASYSETIPPTVGNGRRAINKYAHNLHRNVPAITKMFFVEERGAVNHRLHYHGMLCMSGGVLDGTMPQLYKRIGSIWRRGFYEVEPEIKPGHYLAKYITKEENDVPIMYYDFGKGICWREAHKARNKLR